MDKNVTYLKKIEIGENFYFSPPQLFDVEIFKEKFECPS